MRETFTDINYFNYNVHARRCLGRCRGCCYPSCSSRGRQQGVWILSGSMTPRCTADQVVDLSWGPRVVASPAEKSSSIFLHPENSEIALGLILRPELALWGASDARLVVDVVVDGDDDAFVVRLIPDLLCSSHFQKLGGVCIVSRLLHRALDGLEQGAQHRQGAGDEGEVALYNCPEDDVADALCVRDLRSVSLD